MNLFMPLEIGLWDGGAGGDPQRQGLFPIQPLVFSRKLGANQSHNKTNAFRTRQKSTKSILTRYVWSAATQTEHFLVPRGCAGAALELRNAHPPVN